MDMLEFTDKLRNWHLWHTPSSFQRPMDNSLQMAILSYHYQGDVVLVLQIPCKSISLTSRRLSIVFTWWVSPYTTSSTTYLEMAEVVYLGFLIQSPDEQKEMEESE